MAPEVLKGHYTSQADIWSVGVIAYMLLSSQMPFYGRQRAHIIEQIMNCQFDFKGCRWKKVSAQAKAFVEDLLVLDPDDRASADSAFRNMWLNQRFTMTVRGPTDDEMDMTVETFQKFAGYSKLKKLVR
jgi:calcium-dependent protein kinase